MARDLTNALLASPNQASTVFGVGGAHPVRQKSLFVMRFLRKAGDGTDDWNNGLSFLVKSIDRPTVQPVVEELNQYNKKRMIHTGVKYSPVNCILYDTADGAAMSMLVQYSQFYFGDFRQDASSYADDIVSAKMFGTTGLSTDGYGFGIAKTTTASVDGSNTQFFFDRVDVFQVWGGEYTCFQLLNPRIANFDPDDLDYENQNAATITMSLNYEAIYHENGGKPQKISSNAALTELFGGVFSGETFDPQPSATRQTDFTSTTAAPGLSLSASDLQSLLNQDTSVTSGTTSDRSDTTTSAGGALSKYGDFDFGDFTSLGTSLPSELSTLTGTTASPDIGALGSAFPSGLTTKQLNELELARIQASGKTANTDLMGAALGNNISSLGDIASGVSTASLLQGNTPLDQVSYDDDFMAGQQTSPETQDDSFGDDFGYAFPAPTLDPSDDDYSLPAPAATGATVSTTKLTVKSGLSLSPLAIATVNTNSDGRSQIGQRKNSSANPLLAYIVEPLPSAVLSPDLVYGRARLIPVNVHIAGAINHQPRPVAGPLNVPMPIKLTGLGFVTVAGSINDSIPITCASHILNTISGSIHNVTWTFNQNSIATMLGVAPILGVSNPYTDDQGNAVSRPIPITISSQINMRTTLAGKIDRARVPIYGDAVGNIRNRAGTLYKPLPITPHITGIVQVTSVNSTFPIKVTMNSVIIQLVHGDLPIAVPITMTARGTHIVLRTGTIAKSISISMATTGTVKAPVIGTINKPVTPAFIMIGNHTQPKKGTIAKSLLITSTAFARVPFFGKVVNDQIKVSMSALGNIQPFGTINRQITINATLTGSSLVFGTIAASFNGSVSASGHSTTNVSPAHRYWRMRVISTDQSVIGPNEIQFRDTNGNSLSGTYTASSSYNATYAPGKAFDRDGSTWWSTAIGQATGAWIELDLGQGGDKEVKDLLIATDDGTRVPTAYQLQYSDDGTYWDTKATASITTPDNNSIYVLRLTSDSPPASQTVEYRGLYRFRATTNTTGDTVRIANLALYNANNQIIPSMSPFASSTSVGTPANAFDNDVNSVWVSSTAEAQTATVGFYAATLDTQIGSISLRADPSTGGGACMPTGFVIEYSNDDGSTWTIVLDESGGVPPFSDGEVRNITLGVNGSVDVGDGSALQVNDNQDVLGY